MTDEKRFIAIVTADPTVRAVLDRAPAPPFTDCPDGIDSPRRSAVASGSPQSQPAP